MKKHPLEFDIPPSADLNLHYPGPAEGFVIGSVTYLIAWVVGIFILNFMCAFCKGKNRSLTSSRYCHENCKRLNYPILAYRKIRFILIFSGRLFTFLIKGVIIPPIVRYAKILKSYMGGGRKHDDL